MIMTAQPECVPVLYHDDADMMLERSTNTVSNTKEKRNDGADARRGPTWEQNNLTKKKRGGTNYIKTSKRTKKKLACERIIICCVKHGRCRAYKYMRLNGTLLLKKCIDNK